MPAADRIKIIGDPGGKHIPLKIRLAWIGCEMPTHIHANDCGHIPAYATEVGSGNLIKSDGYDVFQSEALWQLEKKQTQDALEALAWWRVQGYPKRCQCFRFPSGSVEVLTWRGLPMGTRATVLTDMETGSFNRQM